MNKEQNKKRIFTFLVCLSFMNCIEFFCHYFVNIENIL